MADFDNYWDDVDEVNDDLEYAKYEFEREEIGYAKDAPLKVEEAHRIIVDGFKMKNLARLILAGILCPEGMDFAGMFYEYRMVRINGYFQFNIPPPLVDFIEVMLDFCGQGLLGYNKAEYSVIRKLTKADKERIRNKLRIVPPLVNICRFVIRKTIVKAAPNKNINSQIEKIQFIPVHLKKKFLNYGDLKEAYTRVAVWDEYWDKNVNN